MSKDSDLLTQQSKFSSYTTAELRDAALSATTGTQHSSNDQDVDDDKTVDPNEDEKLGGSQRKDDKGHLLPPNKDMKILTTVCEDVKKEMLEELLRKCLLTLASPYMSAPLLPQIHQCTSL